MSLTCGRRGFTLVEVMIVVVTMAILAGVAIPRFTEHTAATKTNAAKFNLRELRERIELYRQQHDGRVPSDSLAELTARTDLAGTIGVTSQFKLGPYCLEIPDNPLTGRAVVRAVASNPPTAASGAADAGWLYHSATGRIWIDAEELLSD